MVSYKQMKYIDERKAECLCTGMYKGFRYFIMSLGTHPTAYIETGDITFSDEDEVFFPVHGGITYQEGHLKTAETTFVEDSNVIGWDYAHYGDQYGTEENSFDKKHTTFKILEEVFEAINYIKNGRV